MPSRPYDLVMQVRHPDFDLSTSTPHWGDHAEAVTVVNAGGIIPGAIEGYMIRLMHRVKRELDPVGDSALLADIEVFNKQEGQHLRVHNAYLEMLRVGGYPRIREFEADFAADLDRFLATESLAWNLGYSEGFESTGAAMASAWVDGAIQELCGDHGSVPMEIWRWHLAEEFEHRSVVHDVLHRLFGPDEALALRTAGSDFGRDHFGNHTAAAAAYMFEIDRADLAPAELAESIERETDAWIGLGLAAGDGLQWVYRPDYDPSTIAAPLDYDITLARYSAA